MQQLLKYGLSQSVLLWAFFAYIHSLPWRLTQNKADSNFTSDFGKTFFIMFYRHAIQASRRSVTGGNIQKFYT